MARDIIHNPIKNALIKDGWTITHDPYTIEYKKEQVYADLAAERPMAAERAGQKIIVEVKSFTGQSTITDFHAAVGQYRVYLGLLSETAPEYKLYLGISEITYLTDFQRQIIQLILKKDQIPLIVVRVEEEEIVQWID